jgi:hypothetical protein
MTVCKKLYENIRFEQLVLSFLRIKKSRVMLRSLQRGEIEENRVLLECLSLFKRHLHENLILQVCLMLLVCENKVNQEKFNNQC